MTVKELQEILKQYNDNNEVIICCDMASDYYSPLFECNLINYIPETDYKGTICKEKEDCIEEHCQEVVALYYNY